MIASQLSAGNLVQAQHQGSVVQGQQPAGALSTLDIFLRCDVGCLVAS
jgi:hypothetical protein